MVLFVKEPLSVVYNIKAKTKNAFTKVDNTKQKPVEIPINLLNKAYAKKKNGNDAIQKHILDT